MTESESPNFGLRSAIEPSSIPEGEVDIGVVVRSRDDTDVLAKKVGQEELLQCERDSGLVAILIKRMTDKNVDAWKDLVDIPSNVVKYYQESLDRLYTVVMEYPQYEGFKNGTLKVKRELYTFVKNYFCSIVDEIMHILSRLTKAKTSKTAEELQSKLVILLGNNQAQITIESEGKEICPIKSLTQFFFELHDFIQKDLSKIKKEELDTTQSKSTKIVVVTPEEETRAQLILTAAQCSSDVYVTEETRVKYEGKWFGDFVHTKIKGQEQWSGFIDYREEHKAIIIAFHGTRDDSKDEIVTDVLADVVALHIKDGDDFGGATVHLGFYQRFNSLKKDLKEHLRKTINDLKGAGKEWDKIVVTGHSLGGAVATLAALNLVNDAENLTEEERDSIQLITFCQPRVLSLDAYNFVLKDDKSKTKALEKKTLRIWRKGDYVPTVPWESMGYKHFGQSWCISYGYSGPWSYSPSKHSIAGVIELLEKFAKGDDIKMSLEENLLVAGRE